MEQVRTRSMKSTSISSDVQSTSGRSVAASVPNAQPSPAYIALAAASQLITAELEEEVSVSQSALTLVNAFLDQILFNILASAHSTNLSQLRTAVPVTLKPRLGKAAVKVADDELSEYLEESDDENPHPMQILNPEFDLDLAWRLARLRCMVYTRLGDLEEEDEEEILEQEQLNRHGRNVRQATHLGPASAIFLTAVLEFLGEQALYYAAQHAQRRAQSSGSEVQESQSDHADDNQGLVVQEVDMSQIGRESPLSRLWRSWRRDTRLPREGIPSSTIAEEHTSNNGKSEVVSPHQIPLPSSERDIDKNEKPTSARKIVDSHGTLPTSTTKQSNMRRPVSMILSSDHTVVPLTPTSTRGSPTFQERSPQRPQVKHRRSHSLPTPSQTSSATSRNMAGEEMGVTSRLGSNRQGFTSASTSQKHTSACSQNQTNPDRPLSPEDDQQVGRVAAALSAVVGALGMTPPSAETGPQSSHTESVPDTEPKTIAEQMLGPSTSVAPPRDAATGPSITNLDDFSGTHVPENVRTPLKEHVPTSTTGTSDPEDLALSSGDEEREEMVDSARASQSAQSPQIAADNSYYNDSDPDQPQRSIGSATGSSSPARQRPADHDNKSTRRQPTIYHESLAQSSAAPTNHQRPDADLSQFPIPGVRAQQDSILSMVATGEGSAKPSVLSFDGRDQNAVAAKRSMVAERHRTPPPPSPNRRPDSTQDFVTSRSSPLPQRISRSSGASNKFPGFDTEQPENRASIVPVGPVMVAGSPSDTAKKRGHLRLRTDSQNGDEEDANKKRSLEQLIDSDETLHYTLTPISARAEQFNVSSRPKTQTQELADFFKNTKPPGDERSSLKLPRVAAQTGLNGLRVSPTTVDSSSQPRKVIPSSKNITPIAAMSTKTASPLGVPRDARVERDATRDLADYARSTGPDSLTQLPKPLAQPISRPGTITTTTSRSSASRLKYQAREASTSRRAEHGDLIDFIRDGPPRALSDHKGDRSTARVRRTIDSDDTHGLGQQHDRDNGSSSVESARNGSIAPSAHSRTPLLDTSNRLQTVAVGAVQPATSASLRQRALAEEHDVPQRTQRRIRDPYAIDYSDDEFEEETPKPKTQDESLIDFLRNTAPSPSMTAQPIVAVVSPAAAVSSVRREVNQSGQNGRTTRNMSFRSLNRKSVKAEDATGDIKQARIDSPHLTQTDSKTDSYRSTKPSHANLGEKSRVKSRAEARGPRTSGNTSDLADYLRTSGPAAPPSSMTAPARNDAREEAGFLKFFSRRKSDKH